MKARASALHLQFLSGFAVKAVGAAASFAFTWLVARAYGPTAVGLFATALGTATLLMILALAGRDVILVRTIAVAQDRGDTGAMATAAASALWQCLLTGLLILGALVLFSGPLARHWYQAPELQPYLALSAFLIPIMVFCRLTSCVVRATGQVGRSQAIESPIGTGVALVLLGAALLGLPKTSPLITSLCYLVGWTISMFAASLMLRQVIPVLTLAGARVRRPTLAGLPVTAAYLAETSTAWIVTYLLISTQSVAAAGVFRVAQQIASALHLLSATTENVLQPALARRYAAGDRLGMAKLLQQSGLGLLLLATPLAGAVLVFPDLIMRLFGKAFESGATAMGLLVLSELISMVLCGAGSVMIMAHRERLMGTIAIIYSVAAGLAAFYAVPRFGLLGAAVSAAAPAILIRVTQLAVAQVKLKIPIISLMTLRT